jgi:hypothetical protein
MQMKGNLKSCTKRIWPYDRVWMREEAFWVLGRCKYADCPTYLDRLNLSLCVAWSKTRLGWSWFDFEGNTLYRIQFDQLFFFETRGALSSDLTTGGTLKGTAYRDVATWQHLLKSLVPWKVTSDWNSALVSAVSSSAPFVNYLPSQLSKQLIQVDI